MLLLVLLTAGLMPAVSRADTVVTVVNATQGTASRWSVKPVTDPSSSTGTVMEFTGNAALDFTIALPAAANQIVLSVRGTQCNGVPSFTLTADGAVAGAGSASTTTWSSQTFSLFLGAGMHTLAVTFTNSYGSLSPPCQRILYLATLTFVATTGMMPRTDPPIPAGFVHSSGTKLLDGSGAPLTLRGVNVNGGLDWQGWIWGGREAGMMATMNRLSSLVGATQAQQFQASVYSDFLTSADFQAIAQDGFNVVRVPFDYRLLENDSDPFVYMQSGWNVLDSILAEAAANNVYVILNMAVAPCSQIDSWLGDYVGPPDLWSSTTCQQRTIAMWQAIASRYANDNVIAGYDLLGESTVGAVPLMSLYQRITAAIRSVDPNHMLIYEGSFFSRQFTMFTSPLDANEMLSPHDYWTEAPPQTTANRMPGYDAAAQAIQAPMWMGEFGQSSLADVQAEVGLMNADPNFSGWAFETWKQVPAYPTLQGIQLSAAAQQLVSYITGLTTTAPTQAEAQQGMSDFLQEIQFQNTFPSAPALGAL